MNFCLSICVLQEKIYKLVVTKLLTSKLTPVAKNNNKTELAIRKVARHDYMAQVWCY